MIIIQNWASTWLVDFSAPKTKSLNISFKTEIASLPPLKLNGTVIENIHCHKHLDLIIDSKLNWTNHTDSIVTKCMKILNIMKRLKFKVDRHSLEIMYKSFIRPKIE